MNDILIQNSLTRSNSNYKILSISNTSTITRNQIEKFFKEINQYDIIIGNYSVIDGLDQFNYNLLILIDPDKISSISNYRSNEIYFQLIFKVIKKVKYDDKEAIIQLFKSDSSEFNLRMAGMGGSELPDLKQEFNSLPHDRGTLSMARYLRKNKKIIFEEIIKVNRMKKFNNNLITIDVDP